MTPYETWENIMAERCASINRRNLPDEDRKMLKDRAIEPFGLWTRDNPQGTAKEEPKEDKKPETERRQSSGPLATFKQKNYIKSLGGTPFDGMTSKEASQMIEDLKAKGGK